MDTQKIQDFVTKYWDQEILETMKQYIEIPNKSPQFDANWKANGHMDAAMKLVLDWLKKHPIPGAQIEVGQLEGRTPLLMVEIPGDLDGNILMYGHLDKQPEMEGWREGLGPWKAVMEGEKLYGRGGADDGYAIFASVAAILALKEQGISHPRIVAFIEFSEESGSVDLPAYLEHFKDKIGTPDLIVCLDSGVGDYERFWTTTSLRGGIGGSLKVEVLTEGVHSGDASGVVPSSFRVLMDLFSRLEDVKTGDILLSELNTTIPGTVKEQAQMTAEALGADWVKKFPWADANQKPMDGELSEMLLHRTWKPTLSYTGIDGVPTCSNAGNVLRPYTEMKLSFRLPPDVDSKKAAAKVQEVLESDPPYGAKVTVDMSRYGDGWVCPPIAPWLNETLNECSKTYFDRDAVSMGEGGSIPFFGMLTKMFPKAQYVITGVLGPNSNAHGPNEFLHVGYVKKLTACIAHILSKSGEGIASQKKS